MVVSAAAELIVINYKALLFIAAIGWYFTGAVNSYGKNFDTQPFVSFISLIVSLISLVQQNIDETISNINQLVIGVNQFRTMLTNTLQTIDIDTLFNIDPQFKLFDRPSFKSNWLTPYTYEPLDAAIVDINDGVSSGIKAGVTALITPPRIGAEFIRNAMKIPLDSVKLPEQISSAITSFQTNVITAFTDLAYNLAKYDNDVQGMCLWSNTSWVTIIFISFIPFLLFSLVYAVAGTQLYLVYSGISNTLYSFISSFLETTDLNS